MAKLKKVVRFFDVLEDKIRGRLSHYPIIYGFLGGLGIVLFWRGIWHLADEINLGSAISLAIGVVLLLLTGVFVSSFIGSKLIISGLKGEKKLAEQVGEEIMTEEMTLDNMQKTLHKIETELKELETEIKE